MGEWNASSPMLIKDCHLSIKDHALVIQKIGKGAWSTHGKGMLHSNMGDHAFLPKNLSQLFNFEDRSQTTIVVGYNVWCIR
jgi:hypothetical protein